MKFYKIKLIKNKLNFFANKYKTEKQFQAHLK